MTGIIKRPQGDPLREQPSIGSKAVPLRHLSPSAAGHMPEMNPQPCKTDQSEVLSLFARHSFEQHFQPNSTLLLHGEPADAVYLVASGTVRCCTIDADGSRQIFSFQRKGEVVGITDMDYWHFTAEAVDHVIVKSMPKSILEQELAVNVALRHEIRAWVRGLLAERERQLLMLSKSKGPDRLLHFLQDYAAKRPTSGFVVLPMCRRDIGDHIGLSTEAVSRAFSHLKRAGQIELKSCEKYRIVDDPKGNLAALPNIKPV